LLGLEEYTDMMEEEQKQFDHVNDEDDDLQREG